MTRKLAILAFLATAHVAGLAGLGGRAASGAAEPGAPEPPVTGGSSRRPNILFVIVDDQSPLELRAYDPASPLATPVIDRLAAEGMVLDAAYHMGSFSGAVCVPSRHMLMSGRSVWHLPIGPNAAACPPRLEEATIPAVFNSAGYDTMRTCKLIKYESPSGGLHTQLFDLRDNPHEFLAEHHDPAVRSVSSAAPGPTQKNLADDPTHAAVRSELEALLLAEMQQRGDPHRFSDQSPRQPARKSAATKATGASRPNIVLFLADDLGYGELGCYGNGTAIGKVDDYSAPFIAQEAVTWLTTKRDPAKPFFLAVWAHEPHYPIASAERYERLHAGITDPETRTYRANITQLDDAFGTVMQALERLGVADDTLVFFTSDNGPEGDGDKGPGRGLAGELRGRKRSMYEGGHRVPGIIRWPGHLPAGTESGLAMIGSDFFPTALAAAGVAAPAGVTLDGVNLLPALAGEADAALERTVPMCWRWGGRVAYREGDWKLVAADDLSQVELYNLARDLQETSNLASGEEDRLGAMRGRLTRLLKEIEAEGPDWWRTEPMSGLRRPSTRDAGRTIGETGGGAQGYP